jgi:parallel beta-helix repeat protein
MSTDGEIIGNVVRNNEGVGIHYETSSDVVISGNTVTGNGFRKNGTREPGILVLNSSGVDITGNTVSNNALGILIRQDTRTSRGIVDDVVISGNTVTMGAGERSGIGQLQYKQIGSVVFSGNTYIHREASPFVLDGRPQTPTPMEGSRLRHCRQVHEGVTTCHRRGNVMNWT